MTEAGWWILFLAAYAVVLSILLASRILLIRHLHRALKVARYERDRWHDEAMGAEQRLRGVGGKGGVVSVAEVGRMRRDQVD